MASESLALSRPVAARRGDDAIRAAWVERASAALDRPMAALSIVFVLVVLAQSLAQGETVELVLDIAAWLLWLTFVADLGLRWWVSPDRIGFLRHNWWQFLLLAVPVLRFVRLIPLTRAARSARVVASALRGSRSAGQVVASRLGWLAMVTTIVVLASSQLLYVDGVYPAYGPALHRAALATVTGEPLGSPDPLAKVMDVVLALYSVVVFATLAGALGAYFFTRQGSSRDSA